jgi:predicted Zn finger-like uncharacterized protein
VQLAIVAMLWLLVLRTFCAMGLLLPVYVAGNSMAPTLRGQAFTLACPQCGAQHLVEAEQWPIGDMLARCTTCGHRFRGAIPRPGTLGSRVLVDRTIGHVADIARWDLVVLRCPDDARSLCVKRVVGLPGESIDFADGDLFVDGERVCKSLEQQLGVRQWIHTDRTELQFWKSDTGATFADSHWQFAAGNRPTTLRFVPPLGCINDDLASNQRLRHRASAMTDLMFSARIECATGASITLGFGEKGPAFPPISATCDVVWSTFDRHLTMAVDGQVVWRAPWPADWQPAQVTLTATEGVAKVSQLSTWRDIHYQWRANDRRTPAHWKLPADELFVVGDNQAASHDSRSQLGPPGVGWRLVLGRAIAPRNR